MESQLLEKMTEMISGITKLTDSMNNLVISQRETITKFSDDNEKILTTIANIYSSKVNRSDKPINDYPSSSPTPISTPSEDQYSYVDDSEGLKRHTTKSGDFTSTHGFQTYPNNQPMFTKPFDVFSVSDSKAPPAFTSVSPQKVTEKSPMVKEKNPESSFKVEFPSFSYQKTTEKSPVVTEKKPELSFKVELPPFLPQKTMDKSPLVKEKNPESSVKFDMPTFFSQATTEKSSVFTEESPESSVKKDFSSFFTQNAAESLSTTEDKKVPIFSFFSPHVPESQSFSKSSSFVDPNIKQSDIFKTNLFGNTTMPTGLSEYSSVKGTSKDEGEEESTEKQDFIGEFKPIVNLKPVEISLEIESDTVLFESHCKLYRFNPELKQYRQCGAGNLKVLKNEKTERCRVLMHRDQLLTVCLNHWIAGDSIIPQIKDKSNSVEWSAMNHTGDQPNFETLAARFKTDEEAAEFISTFKNSVDSLID